jgi:hypothetical protein
MTNVLLWAVMAVGESREVLANILLVHQTRVAKVV